jgi:hypothetical protein
MENLIFHLVYDVRFSLRIFAGSDKIFSTCYVRSSLVALMWCVVKSGSIWFSVTARPWAPSSSYPCDNACWLDFFHWGRSHIRFFLHRPRFRSLCSCFYFWHQSSVRPFSISMQETASDFNSAAGQFLASIASFPLDLLTDPRRVGGSARFFDPHCTLHSGPRFPLSVGFIQFALVSVTPSVLFCCRSGSTAGISAAS